MRPAGNQERSATQKEDSKKEWIRGWLYCDADISEKMKKWSDMSWPRAEIQFEQMWRLRSPISLTLSPKYHQAFPPFILCIPSKWYIYSPYFPSPIVIHPIHPFHRYYSLLFLCCSLEARP